MGHSGELHDKNSHVREIDFAVMEQLPSIQTPGTWLIYATMKKTSWKSEWNKSSCKKALVMELVAQQFRLSALASLHAATSVQILKL